MGLGLGGPLWLQILVFTVLSVVGLLSLRGPIVRRMHAAPGDADPIDSLVGAEALALGDISVGEPGQVELRGTTWKATHSGELAKASNTLILPATVSDVGSMIALAMNVIRHGGEESITGS